MVGPDPPTHRNPSGPADIRELVKLWGFVPEKWVRILLWGEVSYFWRKKSPNPPCWPRQWLSGSMRDPPVAFSALCHMARKV